jgi:hypothetical protein
MLPQLTAYCTLTCARVRESIVVWAVITAALVCEKFGHHAECLPYLEMVLGSEDWLKGGTDNVLAQCVARTIQGRAFATLGRTEEATSTLETAAEEAHSCGALSSTRAIAAANSVDRLSSLSALDCSCAGIWLHEVFALHDLNTYVRHSNSECMQQSTIAKSSTDACSNSSCPLYCRVSQFVCCVPVQVLEKAGAEDARAGRARLATALRQLAEPEAVGVLLGGLDVATLLQEEP